MGRGTVGLSCLVQPKHWTIGVLSNNIWSFAGNQGRTRVNQFLTQYFVTRNFEHGWFLTSSPILTANWRASDDNQWLVPFGGGFGKMTRFFSQPMVWQMHAYYKRRPSKRPALPEKWQVRPAGGSVIPGSEMRLYPRVASGRRVTPGETCPLARAATIFASIATRQGTPRRPPRNRPVGRKPDSFGDMRGAPG